MEVSHQKYLPVWFLYFTMVAFQMNGAIKICLWSCGWLSLWFITSLESLQMKVGILEFYVKKWSFFSCIHLPKNDTIGLIDTWLTHWYEIEDEMNRDEKKRWKKLSFFFTWNLSVPTFICKLPPMLHFLSVRNKRTSYSDQKEEGESSELSKREKLDREITRKPHKFQTSGIEKLNAHLVLYWRERKKKSQDKQHAREIKRIKSREQRGRKIH